MARIEVVFNDDTRLRGIFTEKERAAVFLVAVVRNKLLRDWNPDDYDEIEIVIDGLSFPAPTALNPHSQRSHQPLDLFAKREAQQVVMDHIDYCEEIKRSFFDD